MAPNNNRAPAKKAAPPVSKAKKHSAKHSVSKKTLQKKDPATCRSWRRKVVAAKEEQLPEEPVLATVPYMEIEDDENSATLKWPPAIFWDAHYPNGILVQDYDDNDSDAAEGDEGDDDEEGVDDDDSEEEEEDNDSEEEEEEKVLYFAETAGYTNNQKVAAASGDRSLPSLTKTEAELWCHKHAAHTAVARRFPIEVGRLLGTITLQIQETGKKTKKTASTTTELPTAKKSLHWPARPANGKYAERCKQITKKQAQAEAVTEALHKIGGPLPPRTHIHARGAELLQQWTAISTAPAHNETWHADNGCLKVGEHDDCYISLPNLRAWLGKGLKAGTLKDLQEGATKELYNGLTKVPVSATDILTALVDLTEPSPTGYGVPLLAVYPRMVRTSTGSSGKKARVLWKIQMGIYMHRLLPEVLTIQTLHTVVSALDEGSYTISQPLSLPPSGPEVFASAPYPKVDTSALEYPDPKDDNDDDEIEVIEIDMEDGDRDELLLSPFSTKGLLKLLENKGCDTSNWPQLERQLQGKFKLDLLLHQQHAICWMVRMENLEGAFGVNSILWEQRTFPDGGSYYYSPAFGQLRLGAPPPLMKGGLLCDEQGLGKTVEVLGLIMATLTDMKREVKEHYEAKKKKPTYSYDGDNYYDVDSSEDEDDYVAHTTLIIVPPALVSQWIHEIEKAVGKTTLTVSLLVSNTGNLQQCLPPLEPKAKTSREEDTDESLWDKIQSSDIILTTYDSLDSKRACAKTLQNVQWGRIVLDEMQEIRSSTTKIAKNCESLQCNKRWMLSGTPLFTGIEDLRGELNFLRLEPFGAQCEDGFFNFNVEIPWEKKDPHAIATLQILGLLALRRSKDMTIAATGGSLLDLKPMTVEYVPVAQTHSERALYCWMEYVVACEIQDRKNSTQKNASTMVNNKTLCLGLLRQLAITPMLLNGGLGCPSQLEKINQLMISFNRREMIAETAARFRNDDDSDDDENEGGRKKAGTVPVMSCDQALRFLTQHQQAARADTDFVSDVRFGGGRGVTNRQRADESAEQRYEDARKESANAEKSLADAVKKRATAHWHLALELITTGHYNGSRKQHKFSGLWKWRRLVCDRWEKKEEQQKPSRRKSKTKRFPPPSKLLRGWRPTTLLKTSLFEKHNYAWAHPHSLLLENVPKEVTQKELAIAMRDAARLVPLAKKEQEAYNSRLSKLRDSKESSNSKKISELEEKLENIDDKMEEWKQHDAKLKLPTVCKVRSQKHLKGFWKAVVQFETHHEVKLASSHASRASGAPLQCRQSVPHIKSMIDLAKEALGQAESELQVHPSTTNKQLLAKAKKELADIESGVRVVQASTASSSASLPASAAAILDEAAIPHPFLLLSRAAGPQRNQNSQKMVNLVGAAGQTVEEMALEIMRQKETIARSKRVTENLHKVVSGEVSEEINQLSAFSILEALSHGEVEKTSCPICLGHLGCDADDDDDGPVSPRGAKKATKSTKKPASITMISCSHFFCSPCLTEYVHGRISSYSPVNCPNCRKTFNLQNDTIQVDITLKDEQEQLARERSLAKQLVREAGKALEESKGHLSADMWRSLFLAFDVPSGVPNRGHYLLTAIPRDVLAHLRAATGMGQVHMKRSDRPPIGSSKGAGRCSKIEALLRDLPKGERVVIFSSNKDCLTHIETVFKMQSIGCHSIYMGQTTSDLKNAVSNWESEGESPSDPPPFPALLVQAGAAAAGLTLTAASKMIIMEPLLKQEEEHQAYARLHRYSQEHAVSVKVYYTPVSVESRLLEWRKGAKKSVAGDFSSDGEFESNFEQDTRVIYRDFNEESGDEKEDASSTSSYEEDGEEEDDEDDDEDDENYIAQANFLLGLKK